MRILFIGCVESSYVFLKALLNNGVDIVGVITKESSSFNADFVDITPLCKKNNVPFIFVKNINDENAVEFIKECNPVIGYCLGWSQLVRDDVIDLFPKGMVGYHPAALPNNRGRHPIIWALALGLKETASSFFMIEKTADTGDILSQRMVEILYEDNADMLMKKLLTEGAEQIVAMTKSLENNSVCPISQKQCDGNSWRKRGRLDGQIDWRMSSRSIYNLVRALSKPYVGAHFMIEEKEIKVWNVREIECVDNQYINIEPGKVISVSEDSFIVKTGDKLIEVLDYDPVDIKAGEYFL